MPVFELILLMVFSFFASVLTVLAGMGGGIVLLALATFILPIAAVVPVVGAIVLGSQVSRLVHFYQYIHWPLARPFMIGAAVGAWLGAQAYALLPDYIISAALGVAVLCLLWMPPLTSSIKLPMPFVFLGAAHTWMSTVTGLGGLLQGYMLRSDFSRHTIIGTIAGSLFCMSVFKLLGYLWIGFDYTAYLPAIAAAIATAFIGTAVGKRCLNLVSEAQFRFVMRWILTLFALRLFWLAVNLYLQSR